MKTGIRFKRIPGLKIDTLYIQTVYVHPKHRGKGRARELLTKFLDTHKRCRILLEAEAFDAGGADTEALVQFYSSLGFTRLYGTPINMMMRIPE